MQNNSRQILTSPLFLLGLAILLLNDFILKNYFHNFLTGKLSDFAGLFIFPLFFTAFFPRRKFLIYISISLLFIFWKSPFSQGWIDIWNSLELLNIGRTIDYTDLLSLSVLPLSYFYLNTKTEKQKTFSLSVTKRILTSFVVLLSVFAFTATTLVEDRNISIVKEYNFKLNKNEIENILKQNVKISNLNIIREADFYPANTEFDPNGFYADFLLKEKICDSNLPEFHFHIQQGKEFTTIKALFASFKCKEESMKPDTKIALKQYEQELAAIFEREVIDKLRQNDSQ